MSGSLRSLVSQTLRLRRVLHQTKIVRCTESVRSYRTSAQLRHPNQEESDNLLVKRQGNIFDEAKKKAQDKVTFHKAVDHYLKRNPKYRRGSVEFIYAAMTYMEDFKVHRDLGTYKKLLAIFPKDVMVSKSVMQAESMHYPKQQQCTIDLMEKMEDNGVIPDDAFGELLDDIFGTKTHAFRRYQKMMYWMPKFKNANPYPVPFELPEDQTELAKLALKRMAVDLENKLSVFQTKELESADDDTFIVSASSPTQVQLIENLDTQKPVFVEGAFKTYLRATCLKYFVLRAETSESVKFNQFVPSEEDPYSWFETNPFFTEEKPRSVTLKPSVHEQEDGTILGMCITGASSEDSLRSWILFLQRTNPKLAQTPIVFSLINENEGSEHYEDQLPPTTTETTTKYVK